VRRPENPVSPRKMESSEMCNEIKDKKDRVTNLHCLDPHVLAEADANFLIYSPVTGNYLFMSKDPSLSHKMHTKLEGHTTRDFERNLFKLEKTESGAYHLQNVETEKYVYVSGEDVLGVEGIPSESKGHFQFTKHGDTGCYMIKNSDKYIYVSKSKAGIPPCPVVHSADSVDDCSHVFQFVLSKDVKNATVQFDIENSQKIATEKESLTYEFENPSDADTKEEVTVKIPDAAKDEFKFETGFEYCGQYTGGVPALCKVDDGVQLKVVHCESLRSIISDEASVTGNATSSSGLTVSPGRKMIVTVNIVERKRSVPFTMEVTTTDKKILKGSGMWYGCATMDSATDIKSVALDGSEE